jgi:hypothetical protein
MLKNKIIHYWLKNQSLKYREIADYFNTKEDFVMETIDEYIKEPYIVRESIMNYE